MVSLGYEQVKRAAAVLVVLPIIVFFIGFLKPVYALIGTLVCLISLGAVLKSRNTLPGRDNTIAFTRMELAVFLGVMLLWGYLGGMNGFFYQSTDWNIRNAVFRDLLYNRWPVVYPQKMTALVYYIGYWLVPAALAKPVYYFFGAEAGWLAARMLLWIWTGVLTTLIVLLMMIYAKADSRRKKVLCLVVFIGFSGMDVLGSWIRGDLGSAFSPDVLHLEWWGSGYQFSSITTCLYWVFNQTVIPWLVILCVLFEEDPRNYLFWGMSCMLSGPFPFVGLVILMVVKAGAYVIRRLREKAWKPALAALLSPSNLIMLAGVFPVLALYFLSNNATAAGVGGAGAAGSAAALAESVRGYLWSGILMVFLMDAGVYLCLFFKTHRKDPLYWTAALSLFILPYFHLGGAGDFAMRATVPGVFMLVVYCAEDAVRAVGHWRENGVGEKLRCAGLLAVFLVGFVTPALEVYRGFYHVIQSGTVMLEDDSVPSIGTMHASINFESSMFPDRFFFNTLAKPARTDTALVYCGEGFFPELALAEGAAESFFRLVDGKGEMVLFNGYDGPIEGRLQLVFGLSEGGIDQPYTVTVTSGEQTYAYEISAEGQTADVPVTVDGTALKLSLSADKTGPDGSSAYFSVSGMRLYDGQGQLLAGMPAQHPEMESAALPLDA